VQLQTGDDDPKLLPINAKKPQKPRDCLLDSSTTTKQTQRESEFNPCGIVFDTLMRAEHQKAKDLHKGDSVYNLQ
jgi:hypothetical protein